MRDGAPVTFADCIAARGMITELRAALAEIAAGVSVSVPLIALLSASAAHEAAKLDLRLMQSVCTEHMQIYGAH